MTAELLGNHFGALVAYIGPGADLSLISSVIGLALTMGASCLFMVMWPLRKLWRRIRGLEKPATEEMSTSA